MTSFTERHDKGSSNARLHGWLAALGVSVAISLLILTPFFWLGNASGHDIQFHVSSWLDAANQWKEGIIFPCWAEWANHGFGEPRFILYPPLSWMLGAALGSIGPWNHVPIVFILLTQTMAGLCAFSLARRTLPHRAALFAAACYIANPYALLLTYWRSDFAEQLAVAFFPLLVLAALQAGGIVENHCRTMSRAILLFAAVFASVWLSNAPAGVIASYSAALLFVWGAFTEKSWRPLARGGTGLAVGFGLASFYLLPAAYEQRWVNIEQTLSYGLLPSQNFLYTLIDDPEHNVFNLMASTVAVSLIVMTGITAIAARREATRTGANHQGKKLWRALLLLAAAATLLMLRLSEPLWKLLPELRYVQFGWRWASIVAVVSSVFAGMALTRPRWRWGVAIAVAAVSGGTGMLFVQHAWWDTHDIPVVRATIENRTGYEGTDEYDSAGDDHTDLPGDAPRVKILSGTSKPGVTPEGKIEIDRWTAEVKEFRVTSRQPVRLALRLLNYPAWRVEVNGVPARPGHPPGTTTQMIIAAPAGTARITVRFTRTPDRTLGGMISLLAFLGGLGLYRCQPRKVRLAATPLV